ncbi:CHAD domain-containing protein [Marinicauda algicola]|uniref:CHAD domain-containing protein n=1 Tax=Marinicauda algicola TaxID=2029849 RepID=A0A4S2H1M4_9PROT|nr:CHAD domain-containing protein [Marinicauda algicola]TGY89323.1 CHAD domain-containing protein [Marinicauda algicola]
MTQTLRKGEDLNAIGALMRAEIANARDALALVEHDSVLAIHEARKAIKKARSNARLIRKGDKSASKRINAAGRRAARVLAEARDADSLEQIARAAAIRCGNEKLAQVLREEAERARAEGRRIDRLAAAAQCREALDAMEAEIARLGKAPFEDPDAVMAEGLARTYACALQRLDEARENPTGHTLHELRKRVKDWRYHAVACKHVWPGGVKRRKKKAKELADTLGDHHDLCRLIDRLDDRRDEGHDAAIAELKTACDALAETALKQAEEVFTKGKSDARDALKDAV